MGILHLLPSHYYLSLSGLACLGCAQKLCQSSRICSVKPTNKNKRKLWREGEVYIKS
jgi:hypothetical protein